MGSHTPDREPGQSRITGSYFIRPIRSSLREAAKLCPRVQDFFDLKAQAMKLRYFPEAQTVLPNGHILDLDWEWIKALPGLHIGELRIDDIIGGHDNLRVIFFVGDRAVRRPLPVIWLLAVLQKKRQDFTANQIEVYRDRRTLVLERSYRLGEF